MYTSSQVILGRKCGLKYVDKAVAKVGMTGILLDTITIYKAGGNPWGDGWPSVDWAFGNAVRNIIGAGEVSMTFNLEEALTPADIVMLGKALGISGLPSKLRKRK